MKKVLPKQAIYINRLSYILYYLDKKNSNALIPYKKAMQFSYDEAKDLIKELKKELYNKEFETLVLKKLKKDEKIDYFFKVAFIDNFKKIESVKINIEKETAEIVTVDNQIITFEKENIFNYRGDKISYENLFEKIRYSINFNKKVNLYKVPSGIYIGLESDIDLDYYKDLIRQYNKIIDITNKRLPVKIEDEELFNESFLRLIELIKIKDAELFSELIRMHKIVHLNQLNRVYYNAKKRSCFTVFKSSYKTITPL